MRHRRRTRLLYFVFLAAAAVACTALLEFVLRAVKSTSSDGTFYVSSSSVNNRVHSKYGWLSHKSLTFEKDDDCYGRGTIAYNDDGFRALPIKYAKDSDPIVCIIGDSTMQGFQIPDGGHLPHLLQRKLKETFERPYVLPLAVGGYGTVQEWMLFEDYCRPLNPRVVVLHWAPNDVINNSFLAERYSGKANNSARRRPYLETGKIVYRRPYPVRITTWADSSMIVKIINSLLLDFEIRDAKELEQYQEAGWQVAKQIASRIADSADAKIVLLELPNDRATTMFRSLGYRIAGYSPFAKEHTCLPRDGHPNTLGHQHMLNALLPVLNEALSDVSP